MNWVEWLNSDKIIYSTVKYLEFHLARLYVRSLNLKNDKDWKLFSKSKNRPINIPASPNKYYSKDWISIGDWLGTSNIAFGKKEYLSFQEAKKFAQSKKIQSKKEWIEFYDLHKLELNLPKTLHFYYKSEWKGWADFLGKE